MKSRFRVISLKIARKWRRRSERNNVDMNLNERENVSFSLRAEWASSFPARNESLARYRQPKCIAFAMNEERAQRRAQSKRKHCIISFAGAWRAFGRHCCCRLWLSDSCAPEEAEWTLDACEGAIAAVLWVFLPKVHKYDLIFISRALNTPMCAIWFCGFIGRWKGKIRSVCKGDVRSCIAILFRAAFITAWCAPCGFALARHIWNELHR